jgi:hypothetical protein
MKWCRAFNKKKKVSVEELEKIHLELDKRIHWLWILEDIVRNKKNDYDILCCLLDTKNDYQEHYSFNGIFKVRVSPFVDNKIQTLNKMI